MTAFTTTSAASNRIVHILFVVAFVAVVVIVGSYLSSGRFMAAKPIPGRAPPPTARGASLNRSVGSGLANLELALLSSRIPAAFDGGDNECRS